MKFKNCGNKALGIYPVVNRAYKLKTLYEVGITTAQLRIKDMTGIKLEKEVIEAIKISEEYDARFFLNDFWELAIKYKAYGIHLGQEDIQDANVQSILDAGIRLGISTHTPKEIDFALEFEPSYLAIGPIYETTSKIMSYNPVGINDLKSWSKKVSYRIVAIGGINIHNIKDIAEMKVVDGIAMISDVHEDGEISKERTTLLIKAFKDYL